MNIFDRRQFIRTGSGALAAAPFFQQEGIAAASPKRKMKLDLSCGRIGVKANQRTAIDLASRNGFEAVVPVAGDLAKLSGPQLGELKAEMKEKNLVFSAAGMSVDFRKDEEKFSAGLKALPEQAAVLQSAGVTRIGTWLMPAHDELTHTQNFRQHVSRLRKIGEILSDHGLRFGLEYVGPKTLWSSKQHPFIHTMAQTKELLAEINISTMGYILDSWHWYTAHETAEDILNLKNEQIIAVDLNDAPVGIAIDEQIDSKRELPTATGVIDVVTFLKSLNQIGYDGPVRAEPFNAALRKLPAEEAVAATAKAMKAAFAKADML